MSTEKNKRSQKGKVAGYLIEKSNLVKLVIFTGLFSLVFVNLYKPFSSDRWIDISSTQYFLYSCVIVFIGIAVIAVSRYLMNLFVRRYSLNNIEYAIWVVLELVILSGFYTLYVLWIRSDLEFWSIEDAVIAFRDININTFLVVFFPYLISWLYFAYDDKNKKIRELEKRLTMMPSSAGGHFVILLQIRCLSAICVMLGHSGQLACRAYPPCIRQCDTQMLVHSDIPAVGQ